MIIGYLDPWGKKQSSEELPLDETLAAVKAAA